MASLPNPAKRPGQRHKKANGNGNKNNKTTTTLGETVMDYKHTSHGCGALRLSLLATAIAAVLMPSVQAVEVDTQSEDWSVRFDNTGKFNYGMRTESADERMLATPNNNDGDYNFKDAGDTVTTRFDLLTELDVVNKGSSSVRSHKF